jgi:hypothetical protein
MIFTVSSQEDVLSAILGPWRQRRHVSKGEGANKTRSKTSHFFTRRRNWYKRDSFIVLRLETGRRITILYRYSSEIWVQVKSSIGTFCGLTCHGGGPIRTKLIYSEQCHNLLDLRFSRRWFSRVLSSGI